MKTVQSVLVALTLIFASTAAMAGSVAYKLRISGLACPFCAYGLEQKLGAISGVKRVTVDLRKGIAVVSMAEDSALDEGLARKAVQEAGFTVGSVEVMAAQDSSDPPSGNPK